jgi:hypothetical protein
MIPTRHDYYRARMREHQRLARRADTAENRQMHEQLVGAYQDLARQYRLRLVFRPAMRASAAS